MVHLSGLPMVCGTPYAVPVVRWVLLCVALAAGAPLQCARAPDPALRTDDGAGEALYDLAQDFKAKGDERSYRDTLRFLVARYPSSRRAITARYELDTDASEAVGR